MITIQKFHLYSSKVSAYVKISVKCFENFGGAMPQIPPLGARLLGALFGGLGPKSSPWRRDFFPAAAPASLNMHVVSTNFAKGLVCKREYDVVL